MTDEATTRREFLTRTGKIILGGAIASSAAFSRNAGATGSDTIRIGVVGCGGRGSGAVLQALQADPGTKLIAMGDLYENRLTSSLNNLKKTKVGARVDVTPDHQFTGFNAYEQVLASDIDVVILATPPGFRPLHIETAIKAGKHVFAEKPGAVDAAGVRRVLKASQDARDKGLFIVAGLQSRYEPDAQAMVSRLHHGNIGDVMSMRMIRYGGGVWSKPRQPGMTDVEYQLKNWYYFNWLSGDFLVEQFVHELDRMAWIMNEYPSRCIATGGRQSRTGDNYGHIYDHFSALFTFNGGQDLYAATRQQKKCDAAFEMRVYGTQGSCIGKGKNDFQISGPRAWQTESGRRKQVGHQAEHDEMYRALRAGEYINNGEYLAKSTLMGIMMRESAYTGKEITWEQMEKSKQDLVPDALSWDTKMPEWTVAVPGITPFV